MRIELTRIRKLNGEIREAKYIGISDKLSLPYLEGGEEIIDSVNAPIPYGKFRATEIDKAFERLASDRDSTLTKMGSNAP